MLAQGLTTHNFMTIIQNPDKEIVHIVREGLKQTGGYCPCTNIKSDDTKCMCKSFREQSEGECHCGLYIKVKE